MQAEPLITWYQPFTEYAGFLAQILPAGAIGFRYAVVRGRLTTGTSGPKLSPTQAVYRAAANRAARIGTAGALLAAVIACANLPATASRAHTTIPDLLVTSPIAAIQMAMIVVALLGFVTAPALLRAGWALAALGVFAGALRSAFVGKWSSLVNPLHVLSAGLWIGTLFVLVVAGLSAAFANRDIGDQRATLVADMVNEFSPLALTMGGSVVLFGVITAWVHLHHLAALWTTPYGYALMAKLCVVAVVFGLGALNWRRLRPKLGTIEASMTIRRSATGELAVAALVLAITAVLVSLPSPKG
jgi:putative copper export protein